MVDNAVIQAAIVAKLKADAPLVAWLAARSSGTEIREAQWQGTVFSLPATRVNVGTQTPLENGPCAPYNTDVDFIVTAFSEQDSSKEADTLAGLVNNALLGKSLAGTGFKSGLIRSEGLTGALRVESDRLWRSFGLYRVNIYADK